MASNKDTGSTGANVERHDYDSLCHHCGASFKNKAQLVEHIAAAHPRRAQQPEYKCSHPKCFRTFFTKEERDEHRNNGH